MLRVSPLPEISKYGFENCRCMNRVLVGSEQSTRFPHNLAEGNQAGEKNDHRYIRARLSDHNRDNLADLLNSVALEPQWRSILRFLAAR